MILEAGLGAAGTSAYFDFMKQLNGMGRVCSYDRAGTGVSEPRPASAGPVTGMSEAKELHALLDGAHIDPPYVFLTHSYGGLVTRSFAVLYSDEVAGLVLEDVSTEWDVPVWRCFDKSKWVDGRDTIDIDKTREDLLGADIGLGDKPVIVVTADDYDQYPACARSKFLSYQDRLATLSSDSIHVRADGSSHFIHDRHPSIMVEALKTVTQAVRVGEALPPCEGVFGGLGTCLPAD